MTAQHKYIFDPKMRSNWRNECTYQYFVRVKGDDLIKSGSNVPCEEYPEDWRERVALLDAAWDGQRYPNAAYLPGVGCVCLDTYSYDEWLWCSRLAYLFEKP